MAALPDRRPDEPCGAAAGAGVSAGLRGGVTPWAGLLTRVLPTLFLVFLATGCTRGDQPAPSGRDDSAPEPAPRIASLSPAMTAMVVALGLGDRVVGRTPWCTAVDPGVPVVGDLSDFDAERLVLLRPTHLLVQPPRAGIDPALEGLAKERGWVLVSQPIDGIEDIRTLAAALPARLAGNDSALRRTLDAAATRLDAEIVEVLVPDPEGGAEAAGPVLMLFALDPPGVFGRGSYLGDILERVGGENATALPRYGQLTLEDVVRAAPRTLLLVRSTPVPPGDDPWAPLRGLPLECMEAGRVGVLVHPDALTPGPGVADVARALRAALATAQRGAASGSGAAPAAPGVPAR